MKDVRPVAFPVTQTLDVPEWLVSHGMPIVPAFRPAPFAHAAKSSGVDDGQSAATIRVQLELEMAQARAAAVEEGRAAGEAEGRATFEQMAERLQKVIIGFVEGKAEAVTHLEQQSVELSVCIARAIIGRELKDDRDYVLRLAREALAELGVGAETELRVGQEDFAYISEQIKMLAEVEPQMARLKIKSDSTITTGCVVETQVGRVDATVDARLESVLDALREGSE